MSFYLGSFSGGLVGGAQSALQMYGMYQGIKEKQHELDAYDQVKAAQDGDAAMAPNAAVQGITPTGPTGQDMSSTATGSYDNSGVAPGTSTPAYPTDPSQARPTTPASSTPASSTPKTDPSKAVRARQIADITKLVPAAKKITDTPTVDPAANPAITSASMDPDAASSPRGLPIPQTTAYAQPTPTASTAPTQAGPPPRTAAAMDPDASSGSPPVRPPLILNGQGVHRAAIGESGIAVAGGGPTGPYAPVPEVEQPPAPPPAPPALSPARMRRAKMLQQGDIPTLGAAPPAAAPPAAAPPAAATGKSLGGQILGALNPMGSAQAAEAPTLPPAQTDVPDLGTAPTHTVVASSGRAPTPAQPAQAQPAQSQPQGQPPSSSQNAARPQAIATQQQTQQADPQAGPAAVTTSAQASPVAPGQTSPTIQSEPTPPVVKPALDIKPYAALRQQSPETAAEVDKIAEKIGVNPARLAAHWQAESGMHDSAPDGKAGEMGPLQITKATYDTVDPRHTLDPRTLKGGLELGALVIRDGDNIYGADTPGSILRYQGGRGTADAFATNADQAKTHFPNGYAYLQRMYGQDVQLGQGNFTSGKPLDGAALVKAGIQGGPEGMLHGLVTSGPPGMPMTDLWRKAESTLVAMAASKGDWAGVAHARDFIFQMSHRGALDNLMEAHRQISAGNNLGAAQALAKAHAFVPDNTVGKFGIDANGKLWGQEFDEHDPSSPLGKPFEITPSSVQSLLNTTQDPATYLATVTAQQKAAAEIRLQQQHGDYYENMPKERLEGQKFVAGERLAGQKYTTDENNKSRQQIAEASNETRKEGIAARKEAGQYAADARVDAAALVNEQRSHNDQTRQQAREAEIAKEVDSNYGESASAMDGVPDSSQARGRMGAIHADILAANPRSAAPPPLVRDAVQGLMTNRYRLVNSADQSKVAVIDPKDPQTPITFMSRSMAMSFPAYRMAEQQRQQRPASPVGAGASSPYAPAATLAGTAQSSGIPMGGATP